MQQPKKDKKKPTVSQAKSRLKKDVATRGSKKSKPAKNLSEATSQMKRAGEKVIATRQQLQRMKKEPKGHFNKRVIGSPEKLRKETLSKLGRQEKTRDSLRGVVRSFKSKMK